MFGFGWLEIAVLIALVVLIFGANRSREIFTTAFRTYHKVNKTKQDLKNMVSVDRLLSKKDKES